MSRQYRKIVLHVGDMKTGSTSIQAALAGGSFPETGLSLHYPGNKLNHNFLRQAMRTMTDAPRPMVAELRNQMRTHSADVCVISAELLSLGEPEVIRHEFEAYFADLADDYEVLHYIRPHIEAVVSRYSEAVKIGLSAGSLDAHIDAAIESDDYYHARRLDAWRGAFGARYHVRPMIRSELVRGDVVADFFEALLGQLPANWETPPSNNESLPAEALALLQQIQTSAQHLPQALRSPLGREFGRIYNETVGKRARSRVQVSTEQAQRLAAAFTDDARELDLRHFPGRAMFGTALENNRKAAAERQSDGDTAAFSPGDVMEIMTRLLVYLSEHVDAAAVGRALHRSRTARLAAGKAG